MTSDATQMTKRAGPLPIFGRTRGGSTPQRQNYDTLKSEIRLKNFFQNSIPTSKKKHCFSVTNTKRINAEFYVLLNVRAGTILVNNQLEAQFFMYVYFYSLQVSGSHVSIIRRIIVSMCHLVYVTLCR